MNSKLALALGVALAVGLVAYYGAYEIGASIARAGWSLVLIPLFHLIPLALTTLAWRSLLAGQGVRQPFARLFAWRWLGESVNALLPVAQVGGDLLRGRFLALAGVPVALTGANVIADLTLGLASLAVFIASGLLVLAAAAGRSGVLVALLGVLLLALLALAFYAVPRSSLLRRLPGGAAALEHETRRLYQSRAAVLASAGWRLAAWYAGAAEIWLALYLLGEPVGPAAVLAAESAAQAVRNAGFVIPAGIGVQEGGYVLGGRLAGIGAEAALAVALVKRARDLVLGLPILAWWQLEELRGVMWRR